MAGNNKDLEIHVRMSRFTGKGTAISAVVLKEKDVGKVQINYNSSGNIILATHAERDDQLQLPGA